MLSTVCLPKKTKNDLGVFAFCIRNSKKLIKIHGPKTKQRRCTYNWTKMISIRRKYEEQPVNQTKIPFFYSKFDAVIPQPFTMTKSQFNAPVQLDDAFCFSFNSPY